MGGQRFGRYAATGLYVYVYGASSCHTWNMTGAVDTNHISDSFTAFTPLVRVVKSTTCWYISQRNGPGRKTDSVI